MNGRLRDVWIRKTNTKNHIAKLLPLVIAVTTLGCLATAPPAGALTLRPLDTVHDTVSSLQGIRGWLLPELRRASSRLPQTSQQHPVSPSSPEPTATSTPTQPASGQGTSNTEPAVTGGYYGEPLDIKVPQPIDPSSYRVPPQHYSGMSVVAASSYAALPVASSPSLLQATTSGWRVGGVLWYWWLLAVATLASVVYVLSHHRLRQMYRKG